MFNRNSLSRSLAKIGVNSSRSIFDELQAAYTDPARHYHNDRHIAECLRHLNEWRDHAMKAAEIEVALWFHDAVYDPRRDDNEEKSAEWAERFLKDVHVDSSIIDRVCTMILATKQHEANNTDSKLLVDIDLLVLAGDAARFDAYDAAIRQEYNWVPINSYRVGRAKVLRRLLERDSIYQTQAIRERYDNAARQNLKRAVDSLFADQ